MTPEEWAEKAVKTPGTLLVAIASVVRSAVAEALSAGLPGVPLGAEELGAIRGRADAATPGPWFIGEAALGLHDHLPQVECHNVWAEGGGDITAPCARMTAADALFAAAARQDVPALLAHADHLEGLLRDLAVLDQEGAYRLGYEAGRKEALDLLRGLEWAGDTLSKSGGCCPVCWRSRRGGSHTDGCRLAEALGMPRQ